MSTLSFRREIGKHDQFVISWKKSSLLRKVRQHFSRKWRTKWRQFDDGSEKLTSLPTRLRPLCEARLVMHKSFWSEVGNAISVFLVILCESNHFWLALHMSCLLLKRPNEECARQEGIVANTFFFSSFFSYQGRPTQENAAHFIKIANYQKYINAKSFSMMANVFLGLFPTRFTRFILVKNVH